MTVDLPSRTATPVALDRVVKEFGSTRVLHGVDLQIGAGEFVSLLGPSGCGKTTALRLIAGLEQPTSGSIRMSGADVTGVPVNKRDIGMVFQAYSLFPHLTVQANTEFGLSMRRVPAQEARVRASEALELVGLASYGGRYPHQLSGGQQQRVALARALVTSPRVLLLDEPLSALDAKVREQLRVEIRRIQQELGITTVFVTHDQEEALAISDRIAVMNEGRIEQIGTPEQLYLAPATPEVAAFVGLSSLIPATVEEGLATLWELTVPTVAGVADGSYDAFVRPEHVRLASAGEPSIAACVEASTFLGSIRRTLLRTADGVLLTMQHPADQHLDRGQTANLTILPAPVVVRPRG